MIFCSYLSLQIFFLVPFQAGVTIFFGVVRSEFSDIFDVDHFKRTLQADVRVVSSLPSTHLSSKPTINTRMPLNVSPLWIRTKFLTEVKRN